LDKEICIMNALKYKNYTIISYINTLL